MWNADEWPPGVRPFVVARPELLATDATGREGRSPLRFDPTRVSSVPFLRLVERLDRATYGTAGLATPRWALYDCAELPGAIVGLCAPAATLPRAAGLALALDGDEPAVPLTLLVAIPTLRPGAWFVYSVCGLAEVAPIGIGELRIATMELAYAWLGAREVQGVAQWAGDRVDLHSRFGPLRLLAAWMPTHDVPASFVFCCSLRDRAREAAPDEMGEAREIDVSRPEDLRSLQAEIEKGAEWFVVGPSRDGLQGRLVPVSRRPA